MCHFIEIDASQDVFNIRGMQASLPQKPERYHIPIAQNISTQTTGGGVGAGIIAAAVVIPIVVAALGAVLYKLYQRRKVEVMQGRNLQADNGAPQFSAPAPTEKTALVRGRV